MGQAKARQLREAAYRKQLAEQVNLENVSTAMRKLATAASSSLGGDCYLHALLTRAILSDAGIEARLTIGFAAWRVGSGDGDVILHAPAPGAIQHSRFSSDALPFHVWLTLMDGKTPWILDFTTYQLHQKARDLDALDGGSTRVDWCPDFLMMPANSAVSLPQVTRGHTGMCFYEVNAEMQGRVLGASRDFDPFDLNSLRLLVAHPHMEVVGPNYSAQSLSGSRNKKG